MVKKRSWKIQELFRREIKRTLWLMTFETDEWLKMRKGSKCGVTARCLPWAGCLVELFMIQKMEKNKSGRGDDHFNLDTLNLSCLWWWKYVEERQCSGQISELSLQIWKVSYVNESWRSHTGNYMEKTKSRILEKHDLKKQAEGSASERD